MEINSEKQDQIIPALIEARKIMTGAVKDEKNPFFKNTYATLPSVIECVNDPLLENGILVTQPTQIIEGRVILITELMHVSGQWKRGYLPIINKKQDDQGQGSSMTFARRQGLLAIMSIPTIDDDGEASADPKEPGRKKIMEMNERKSEDDIPYPDEISVIETRISEREQSNLISLVCDLGLQDQAKGLIQSHGFEDSSKITKDKLQKITKEIKKLGNR